MAQHFPLGVDNNPAVGRNYLLFPVHDARQKMYLHIDSRVYSLWYATDGTDIDHRDHLFSPLIFARMD